MWYTHCVNNNTVLFLHGPMLRDTRMLLEGLVAYAARRNWCIQQILTPKKTPRDYLDKLIAFWNPLGLVATYGHDLDMPLPNSSIHTPFVCIDLDNSNQFSGNATPSMNLGFVNCNSKAVAEAAARELLKRDFAAYAYVSAYTRYHWSETRRTAFRTAIELNGGRFFAFDGTGIEAQGADGTKRLGAWLATLPKPCGLLVANDRIGASIVLPAAMSSGISIPDDISIIGIDDDESVCEQVSPPLTSIRLEFREGGLLAGQALDELLIRRQEHPSRSKRSNHSFPQLLYSCSQITHRLSARPLVNPGAAVKRALETIRRRATEGISSADILPILGGSRRAAEKKFRAAVGKSILEEILDVRFERLLPILLSRNVQLGALAGRTGFSSENHLQRIFKARFGMTLSQYRRTQGVRSI